MSDITMCIQTQCPNASHCYRVQATPSHYQSMAAFDYVVEDGFVQCTSYIPVSVAGQDQARVWYCDGQGRGD